MYNAPYLTQEVCQPARSHPKGAEGAWRSLPNPIRAQFVTSSVVKGGGEMALSEGMK